MQAKSLGKFMFSKRTQWKNTPNKLTLHLTALRENKTKILDLTESNPTRAQFHSVSPKWLDALTGPGNIGYAPVPKGILKTREAICHYYSQKGIDVHPEQIILTASTSEAYSFLFRLLANPNDRVLFPAPSYPLFHFLSDLNDIQPDFYALTYENRWKFDRETLRVKSGTKAFVLVNPNNPTGSYLTSDELKPLMEHCGVYSLPLISDEVFHDYTDKPQISTASIHST